MMRSIGAAQRTRVGWVAVLLLATVPIVADAADLQVFHADSLAGPMRELKKAFEAQRPDVNIVLSSGVSRQLAERIVKGEAVDVFASSSPAVIDEDMINKPVAAGPAAGKTAATWYVVFSANEMVVITAKGNPQKIAKASDLARVRFVRVNGDKDLATGRTVTFLQRATAAEGEAALAQKIIDSAPATLGDPGKPVTVPAAVDAVRQGRADAAVVYYSAAVAARSDVEIIRFPDSVNMSEAIRNAATVPATTTHAGDATAFVAFLLTPMAQGILKETGQPPVVPAFTKGAVPAGVR
jgi:molybdate transport system substrate-binding protein